MNITKALEAIDKIAERILNNSPGTKDEHHIRVKLDDLRMVIEALGDTNEIGLDWGKPWKIQSNAMGSYSIVADNDSISFKVIATCYKKEDAEVICGLLNGERSPGPTELNHPPHTYQCKCCHCGELFFGDKREVSCPKCSKPTSKEECQHEVVIGPYDNPRCMSCGKPTSTEQEDCEHRWIFDGFCIYCKKCEEVLHYENIERPQSTERVADKICEIMDRNIKPSAFDNNVVIGIHKACDEIIKIFNLNSQERVAWPEKREHHRECKSHVSNETWCDCGAKDANDMRDALMKVINSQPQQLEPLDVDSILERIEICTPIIVKVKLPNNKLYQVHRDEFINLKYIAESICSKFGTKPVELPSVKEIEMVLLNHDRVKGTHKTLALNILELLTSKGK